MVTPRISVIMIDGSFREYFHALRFFGDQTLAPEEYELIWVEFYQDVHPDLRAEIEKFPNFRIVTLNHPPDTPYHASYCFNGGISAARADVIAIPDADLVVEPRFLAGILAEHETSHDLVMYHYRYNMAPEDYKPDWDLPYLKDVCILTNPSNRGACLTVRKKWLLEINGYDQHPAFAGNAHGNDYNVYVRLNALGLCVKWHPDLYTYHPWHPGTFGSSVNYRLQRAISDYKARSIDPLAFHGIDPARNHEFPSHLYATLEQVKRDYEAAQPKPDRIRQLGRRIRGKIKKTLS